LARVQRRRTQMMPSNLDRHGWNPERAAQLAALGVEGLRPARVVVEHRGAYELQGEEGALRGEASGRLRRLAVQRRDLPAVGDWVGLRTTGLGGLAAIDAILPRHGIVSRKATGERAEEQVVAVNVDVLFVAMGLDANYNLRRLERAVTLAYESGARPVVLLTKSDLAGDELLARLEETKVAAPGVPVLAISATRDEGIAEVEAHLVAGETVALIGSSGVGKSTLLNRLCGAERQTTGPVRAEDAKGRHTTTARELVVLPGGALLVDTPGLREVQLWAEDASVARTFTDVLAHAEACRFRDCRHDQEPGCAVRAALFTGELAPEREASHRKLVRELRHLELRQDERARLEEARRVRVLHRNARRHHPRE
ncbi:MAG: ribosome small subunit-dependent GTPase A, partial [bacterium]